MVLDATSPQSDNQVDIRTPTLSLKGRGSQPTKLQPQPLEVTLKDLYPAVAAYGDEVTASVVLRNATQQDIAVPCSRDDRRVLRDENRDRRYMIVSLQLTNHRIPAQIIIASFSGSPSEQATLCQISPGGTILIRGKGRIYSPLPLQDPKMANTTLQVKARIREDIYDNNNQFIRRSFSVPRISENSMPLYYLGAQSRQ
jgi:hypothetical protein